jgi:hypothetical protein
VPGGVVGDRALLSVLLLRRAVLKGEPGSCSDLQRVCRCQARGSCSCVTTSCDAMVEEARHLLSWLYARHPHLLQITYSSTSNTLA